MEQILGHNRNPDGLIGRILSMGSKARPAAMGMLTRRMLGQMSEKLGMTEIFGYHKTAQDKDAERNNRSDQDDKAYREWAGRASKDKKNAATMADVAHTATLYQIDPTTVFKTLSSPLKPNAERRVEYDRIKPAFDALPQEWKDRFVSIRDNYSQKMADLEEALIQRFRSTMDEGDTLNKMIAETRNQFKSIRGKGPYFPLARFGDYIVIAEKDGSPDSRIVQAFESERERQKGVENLVRQGYTSNDIKLTKGEDNLFNQVKYDGTASKMVDLIKENMTGDAEQKQALLNDMNQLLLRSMPDSSFRKNFIHRKGVAGYSEDMVRAFATTSGRLNNTISSVKFDHILSRHLSDAKKQLDQAGKQNDSLEKDILNEMNRRHEAMQTMRMHPVSGFAGAVGFTWSIGPSIASALVNLSQTPLVTYPLMASKYGYGAAGRELMKAIGIWGRGGKFNMDIGIDIKKGLSGDDLKAIQDLEKMGAIDLTNTIELMSAGSVDHLEMAQGKITRKMHDNMRFIGAPFHYAEVANRQVTSLAAYRLARKAGKTHDAAVEEARTLVYDSHFDYSSSNRARHMQSNWMRPITMFKQYSLNMTWLMGRALMQATKDADPEVRRQAQKQLAGMLGGAYFVSGALGMPVAGMVTGMANALQSAFGDDEYWDAEDAARRNLADIFGKDVGEAIARGPARMILPWDIANRTSIDMLDMWMPRLDESAEGKEAGRDFVVGALGPLAGNLVNVFSGVSDFADGHELRGIEKMLPKALKDAVKTARYASEDMRTKRDERLLDEDITATELLGQLIGFSPRRLAEVYEGRNAIKFEEQAIKEARTRMVNQWINAEDREERAEIVKRINAFNKRHPQERIRITGDIIRRSMRSKARSSEQTIGGTYLSEGWDHLRERGSFANL